MMKPLNRLSWTTRLGVAAIFQAGVFLMVTPSRPLQAATGESFQVCAEELQEVGLSAEEAATACADALHPQDLSLCVLTMNQEVGVPAEEALFNCYRDRKPLDLASCVINISQGVESDDVGAIVENCRRSLLPLRYSECVVGLTHSSEEAVSPLQAMNECISADAFPSALTPVED